MRTKAWAVVILAHICTTLYQDLSTAHPFPKVTASTTPTMTSKCASRLPTVDGVRRLALPAQTVSSAPK